MSLHTVFSIDGSRYHRWQAELLAHSHRRVGQPGRLTCLMSTNESPPPLPIPTLRTRGFFPHPVTGDKYLPYNKPYALSVWIERERPDEESVLIIDPDCVFFRPLTLSAKRGRPISQPISFMDKSLAPAVVRGFCRRPDLLDPIGVPMLIHRDDLAEVAPLWLSFTEAIRGDPEAREEVGWIAEMWGYCLAAAELGLRHEMVDLAHFSMDDRDDLPLLHYTYTSESPDQSWSWSKRDYRPWARVADPPPGTPRASVTLITLLNDLVAERTGAPAAKAPAQRHKSSANTTHFDRGTMQIFRELGSAVGAAWERADFDEAAFPKIAEGALRERRLHREITSVDVFRWLLSAHELPEQDDIEAQFGQPPITVYQGRRFCIQVLCWLRGSTSIHRHGFVGGFTVLEGSSIQTRYAYEERRKVNTRLSLGDLRLVGSELLERGDVIPITHDLIHGVFHLEEPSITVVLRSLGDGEGGPQFEYHRPGLAVDPFYRDPPMIRRIQALEFLRASGSDEHDVLAAELIASSDLHTAWLALKQASSLPTSRFTRLVEAARQRHGAIVDALFAAIEEYARGRALARLRAKVKKNDLRFFLALVQSVPERDAIDALIRRRAPNLDPGVDPREKLVAWAEELSGVDAIGVDLRDPLNRVLFGALLDGCPTEEVVERLKAAFSPDEVDARRAAIRRHCERIRQTALAPLWKKRLSREGGADDQREIFQGGGEA